MSLRKGEAIGARPHLDQLCGLDQEDSGGFDHGGRRLGQARDGDRLDQRSANHHDVIALPPEGAGQGLGR